jgi:hypothetical protein
MIEAVGNWQLWLWPVVLREPGHFFKPQRHAARPR